MLGETRQVTMESTVFERASRRLRASGRMVVRSPNPVHAVLYRVVVFVNSSRRRFLLQVEFRARLLRVVYVGAIAVLFRFVVMMLNLSEGSQHSKGADTVKGGRGQVFAGMTRRLGRVRIARYTRSAQPLRVPQARSGDTTVYVEWVKVRDPMSGITALGQVLYSDGRLYVVGAGMVLLVAMLGSIVLTLQVRTFARAKRQQVDQQRARDGEHAVRRVKSR
jgi:NADH-quinone oxidoreductase subunit J